MELAVAALDERYNPNDHVDVRLQSLFEFIIRHPKAREKLGDNFKAINKYTFPEHGPPSDERRPPDKLITRSLEALEKLWLVNGSLCLRYGSPGALRSGASLTNGAATKLRDIRDWAWNRRPASKGQSTKQIIVICNLCSIS